jgi:hypothetical protein
MTSKTIIAGVLATLALALPSTSHAQERDRSESEERKPNRSMLITGSVIFLGTYAGSATVGAFSDTKGDKNLSIPVVGPWIDVAERDCKLGDCTTREDVNIVHLIGSGAAQAAGLGILIGSFFVHERKDGRPAPQPKTLPDGGASAKVQILPLGLRAGAGIGAFGTF